MPNRLLIKLSTRRCRGCDEPSVHTAHLTWLGRHRYTLTRSAWRRRWARMRNRDDCGERFPCAHRAHDRNCEHPVANR